VNHKQIGVPLALDINIFFGIPGHPKSLRTGNAVVMIALFTKNSTPNTVDPWIGIN
jgi:hypothetical protein